MSRNLASSKTFSSMLDRKRSASTLSSINMNSNLRKTDSRQSLTSSLVSSVDTQNSFTSSAVPVSLRKFQQLRYSRPRLKATMLPEQNFIPEFLSKRSTSMAALNDNSLYETSPVKLADKYFNEKKINRNNAGLLKYQSLNDLSKTIINSQNPINLNETEEITVNNIRGIWANRTENLKWKGALPLNQYRINHDPNPEIIMKKPTEKLRYVQDINVRYLNPPKLDKPGDIIIRQEPPRQIPPGPPLVIRQTRPRPPSPPQLIFREEPPKTPEPIPPKVITIPGRLIPPPPRKVVIETLPELPPKPQSILIERWMPYSDLKRRVIFQRPSQPEQVFPEPKNLIVNWEKPDVEVVQELKFLGVEEVNPREYRSKFLNDLRPPSKLPEFVHRINPPQGIKLAIEKPTPNIELEGDLEALKLLDLDKVGLSEYREYLNQTSVLNGPPNIKNDSLNHLLKDLFITCDIDKDGLLTNLDVQRIVLHLNNRFGISYDEKDVVEYFSRIQTKRARYFNFEEFSKAFDSFYSL